MFLLNNFVPFEEKTISIAPKEIHLWKCSLLAEESEFEHMAKFLSEKERTLSQKFINNTIMRRYLVSHTNLRKILSFYLHIPLSEIEYSENKYKKPALMNDVNLSFNMSHSGEMALYAIALNSNIGVDIEQKNCINVNGLSKMILTDHELDTLHHAPRPFQSEMFYRYWTCKEAYMKAIGMGFHFDPKHIETTLSQNNDIEIAHIIDEPTSSEQWHAFCVNAAKGYASTFVVDFAPVQYRFYQF